MSSAAALPGLPSPRLTLAGRLRGDKAPDVLIEALALIDAPASGRMAIGEALTNLAAAPIADIASVKLSANWMAACGAGTHGNAGRTIAQRNHANYPRGRAAAAEDQRRRLGCGVLRSDRAACHLG